jgi:hypothetical protein
MASAMPFRWWAEEGPRTQLRPDTYLEWSNSEINTTGRNDVPAEPVRIEVRRWLRTGGLRATPGHYRRNFASENNDYRK